MSFLFDKHGQILSLDAMGALSSINIEYGRTDNADYYFLRIPAMTNNGEKIRPKVSLTSADKTLNGTKSSALVFAEREKVAVTLNAGLFDTSTLLPQGQTIIDGISITNTPMTDDMGTPISDNECYPLCIDGNGDLSAPYQRNIDTNQMIEDGIEYAVTGWGKFIEDYKKCEESVFNEIVHPGTYIRQCIGQFGNGDYFVCSVDKTYGNKAQNSTGMTYEQLANLLISKGVKFAYSLDGGGSCETVIGQRQINPIYDGTKGRAVPTVIYFDIE